jgi:hypothetical protein
VIVGVLGSVLWWATDPTRAAINVAVRAAILTDMTVVELPPGNSPGHVTDQVAAELRDRLTQVLPTVYTGDLLTLQLDELSSDIEALRSSESIGSNAAAGITSLTVLSWPVFGSHADVSGSFSSWVTGRHWEGGRLVDDRAEAAYDFNAGLDNVDGRWLVSSWHDRQTN